MNTSGNNLSLCEEDIWKDLYPGWEEWVYITMYLLTLLSGVIGNSMVCYFILRYAHMRSVTNIFIFNLAVADLLVLLISLIPTMIQDIFESWLFGELLCPLATYIKRVSFVVSILSLCAISIQRYYVVCKPVFLRTIDRKRWTFGTTLVIWVISLSLCIPEILRARVRYHCSNTPYYSNCRASHSPPFYYGYTLAFFIIPGCVMTPAYFCIVRTLWSPAMRRFSMSTRGNNSRGDLDQLLKRRNIAKMFITVVVCFFICHVVHHVVLFAKLQMGNAWYYQDLQLIKNVIIIGHILVFVSSALNPVIYSFMGETYRELLRSSVQCSRNTEGSSDVSKAFDKVWHDGLLFKLEQLGIEDPLLAWLKDYLCDRKIESRRLVP